MGGSSNRHSFPIILESGKTNSRSQQGLVALFLAWLVDDHLPAVSHGRQHVSSGVPSSLIRTPVSSDQGSTSDLYDLNHLFEGSISNTVTWGIVLQQMTIRSIAALQRPIKLKLTSRQILAVQTYLCSSGSYPLSPEASPQPPILE